VQMSDTWGHVEGARPKHRHDTQVLHPVLGLKDALS